MVVGIDASNVGGGGGITHLKEILNEYDDLFFSNHITKVVIFSSQKVLDELPDLNFIEKVTFSSFNGTILNRLIFQIWGYDREIKNRCDILLSITGDYIGKFSPVVSMSRNMLLYERDIWKEINQPKEILRFWLNFIKQKKCFLRSKGIIFISYYAKNYIDKVINLKGIEKCVIHHGVSPRFRNEVKKQKKISDYTISEPYKFLYVSTVHVYKHQWNLVEAIGKLRSKGYFVELNLVGEVIFAPAGRRLTSIIDKIDPQNKFIHNHLHIPHNEIDEFYKEADGVIFASTCENMPNILIESMASGLPIACSEKNPMPEFLKDYGVYFNSKNIDSIVLALEKLLLDTELRHSLASKSLNEVKKYSWRITSRNTFEFLIKIYK